MVTMARPLSGSGWRVLVILSAVVCLAAESGSVRYVEQHTGLGTIRGTEETFLGTPLHVFNRVPFAIPPVGNRRFTHSEEVEPWNGVYDGTQKPNSCMQPKDMAFQEFPGVDMWNARNKSEDCLYLTIWTPSLPDRDGIRPTLPVLVWIFGGGFYSGTSTLDIYDGRALAAKTGMVIVSIQYRVSVLGFMYLGTSDAPGNQGLMDQVLALRWIKNRIVHFGGDNNDVTLFGESAGAVSVAYHLISDTTDNLFHRVILQSGSALCRWAVEEPAEAKARHLKLAEFVGCPTDVPVNEIIACLRLADPIQLGTEIFLTGVENNLVTNVMATIDGIYLKDHPYTLVETNKSKPIDILLGSMKDEGAYFLVYSQPQLFNLSKTKSMSKKNYEAVIHATAKSDNQMLADAVEFEYEVSYKYGNDKTYRDILDDAIGDSDFICPVVKFAEIHQKAGNRVYMYHFMHDGSKNPWPEWMGIMHGYEIDFVFGLPLHEELGYTEDERVFSERIMTFWTSFAKTGNPNPSPSPNDWPPITWLPYTATGKEYLQLRVRDNFTMAHGMRNRQCAFWNDYMPKLQAVVQDATECQQVRNGATNITSGSLYVILILTALHAADSLSRLCL